MTGSPLAVLTEVSAALRGARRVLIASDFDGTLCPIVASPGEARITRATKEILEAISGRRDLTLAVISGRQLKDLVCRLPGGHVYSGNHGLEISGHGLLYRNETAVQLRPDLETACRTLSEALRMWPGAWVEDKGLTATLHYRNSDPRHHRLLRFITRKIMALHGRKFRLRAGKKSLEIAPRIDWDKGSALDYIRKRLGPFDTCLCLGDDRTDEAMFRTNHSGLNVRVGAAGPTRAALFLRDPADTALLLERVLQTIDSGAPQSAGTVLQPL